MGLEFTRSARFWWKMRSERVRTEITRRIEAVRVAGHVTVSDRQVEEWIAV